MESTDKTNDTIKANLYLAGIIGTFLFLTLIAFLFTEGRALCVIPIMRLCCPKSRWVNEQNKIESEHEESNLLKLDMAHHVFGVKKAPRQPCTRHVIIDDTQRY